MRELSLHIMDIIENGLNAGADVIALSIVEDRKGNRLTITIQDNGRGMTEEVRTKALDPFYTSRTTRRVGLGLSLFREASKRCGGEFVLESEEGRGTRVSASFELDHIDLSPMGDMAGSLTSLMMGTPDVDYVYRHEVDGRVFELDTREVRKELEGVPLNDPTVMRYLGDVIRDSLGELSEPGGGD